MMKRSLLFTVLVFNLLAIRLAAMGQQTQNPDEKPGYVNEQSTKPWTYWWWMGNAVTKEEITRHLEAYAKAGLGGVHIIPIYGAKGYEDQYIDFLSEEYMELLDHAIVEANYLGMGVDMSLGTGWPFGGPWVQQQNAARKLGLEKTPLMRKDKVQSLQSFIDKRDYETIEAIAVYSSENHLIEAIDKRNWDQIAEACENHPEGAYLITLYTEPTGQQVKRAAPGGEGPVVDFFDGQDVRDYLHHFYQAFNRDMFHRAFSMDMARPRAFYNDSYEVYGANITEGFAELFEEKRGYSMLPYLPLFYDTVMTDTLRRFFADYHHTISDLLYEHMAMAWTDFSRDMGSISRYQAHGSPGNLLDLYACADVPETEVFRSSGFDIPGMPQAAVSDEENLKPYMIRFASSAANLSGKPLVSSETGTWLDEHFSVSLSQVKPEVDQLFTSGVNHIFYHGMTYWPASEEWPGWLFYASTNFGMSSHFWDELPALNRYITIVQHYLQNSGPDNHLLFYFPIHDIWHQVANQKLPMLMTVHNAEEWFFSIPAGEAYKELIDKGFQVDLVSDKMLQEQSFPGRTLVLPECHYIPAKTIKAMVAYTIICPAPAEIKQNLSLPGLGTDTLDEHYGHLMNKLDITKTFHLINETHYVRSAGSPPVSSRLEWAYDYDKRELLVKGTGLRYIRKKYRGEYLYFISNLGHSFNEGWVYIDDVQINTALLIDPLTGDSACASLRPKWRGKEVYLQLPPGKSMLLLTGQEEACKEIADRDAYYINNKAGFPIDGPWEIRFTEGQPERPDSIVLSTLLSWTDFGDGRNASYSGKAEYSHRFDLPKGYLGAQHYYLRLGEVRESARVRLNGRDLGLLWCAPFELIVPPGLLKAKVNELKIEVKNLSVNRIAELDRQGTDWKKFHNINIVDIHYNEFDASVWEPAPSGLLGPVSLTPVVGYRPGE